MNNSEKTIIEKLNLRKYPAKLILGKPDDIADFDGLEYDTSAVKEKYSLIFTFIFHLEEFVNQLNQVIERQLLEEGGYLFFAYPKKNNPKYAEYIERDSFFAEVPMDEDGYVGGSPIKFARMVSLNDVFTVIGLKSQAKKAASSTKPSQCVDDYLDRVKDIKAYLQHDEEIGERYNQLTPGYQKDWARYVYSAKKKETQDKRLAEMKTVLAEGYKTMDLYRRNKK
ncbi:YdeI/OmpD-associated family protein [Paenibacillus dendritiformis]|uniref:YdeI/OmpD-associated family protein n=1 Tax=Paenibacillus dendritiformis TaxID=130049 RepID=UPI00143D3D51|nr:YdeI/OmpD-associated family protein [Paenibacillus dendritiformis]NKI21410.1 YdeI/OmpD-associated family protein [Paenibacillus dendritiformis]NRF97562.1 YdeI/OmpD-associated family protein [Paenibacillus dendritiformis]